MTFLIIAFVLFVVICLVLISLESEGEAGVAYGLFIVISLMGICMIFGVKTLEGEAVKEQLVKDKKIEWKVSNDGQPYLILKDSSLVETWKYLK